MRSLPTRLKSLIFFLRRKTESIKIPRSSKFFLAGLGLSFIFLITTIVVSAPRPFQPNDHITIPSGSSLREVAELLAEESIIRSPFLFQVAVQIYEDETGVQAGVYTFPRRFSVFQIARAVANGSYQVPPFRIVVFEGMRVEQIAEILEHENNINYDEFVELAKPYEGYLFPETYFIPDDYDAQDIVDLMRQTFNEKVAPLHEDIEESVLTFEEVIVLASILEREARSEESMRMVAGILLKRMEIDMPLQVDAPFEYFISKSSAFLTYSDLALESPYNTYLNTGLPPTPIANPGLKSIRAVLNPIESDYLFYLTAPGGEFHYSRTYEEHKYKKDLYL